ncbi:hypothetical protein HNV12_25220 [Methanococcoides sp. SA1]|nr:hypothetical protein [Methanococcoides sp. SA1]
MREGWVQCSFGDLLDYLQPTNYIVNSTEYNDSYDIPVLTAGKSFIKGYTNEKEGIFNDLPTIIFDDFTTASQFVNFKFKVKSSAMKILVPTSRLVNMKFTFYCMQVNRVRSETHKRYWISVYSKKKLLLPSLIEQRTIVSKIEQLFSELDNGIRNFKTAQKQLKIYRQAVLKKAFEGDENNSNYFLSEVTRKIQIGPFGSQLHKHDYIEGGIPLINPMHIQKGKIVSNSSYSISAEKRKTLPNYILKSGDVIMGRRGEMGRCGLVSKREDGWFCGTGSLYFRPKSEIVYSPYLYYYLTSDIVVKMLSEKGAGTTMTNLNKKIVSNIPINLPNIDKQHQIVQEIESRLSVCDKLEESIEESLLKAEALRKSILKQAFEGRLLSAAEIAACRKEKDWEPAEKLLARIKKEKELVAKKKK